MTNKETMRVNQALQEVPVKNTSRMHKDGESKFHSQTTWGPSRRKKRRHVGKE